MVGGDSETLNEWLVPSLRSQKPIRAAFTILFCQIINSALSTLPILCSMWKYQTYWFENMFSTIKPKLKCPSIDRWKCSTTLNSGQRLSSLFFCVITPGASDDDDDDDDDADDDADADHSDQ